MSDGDTARLLDRMASLIERMAKGTVHELSARQIAIDAAELTLRLSARASPQSPIERFEDGAREGMEK